MNEHHHPNFHLTIDLSSTIYSTLFPCISISTMIKTLLRFLVIGAFFATLSTAWTPPIEPHILKVRATKTNDGSSFDQSNINLPSLTAANTINTRRELLQKTIQVGALSPSAAMLAVQSYRPSSASANGTEKKCNPLEGRCRQDDKLGDEPYGKPILAVTNKITYVVQMIIDIGE